MHIVFVGNCQVQTLAAILRRFVSPYVAVTTEFLDAFSGNTTHFVSRVKSADAVVAQLTLQPQPVVQDVIAATRAHIVPAVSGASSTRIRERRIRRPRSNARALPRFPPNTAIVTWDGSISRERQHPTRYPAIAISMWPRPRRSNADTSWL